MPQELAVTSSNADIQNTSSSTSSSTDNKENKVASQPGPPVISQDNLELTQKLRDGKLNSSLKFARCLGLTEEILRCLIGVFSRTESSDSSQKQYKFQLLDPSTNAPHPFHFAGQPTTQIENGNDGRLIKDQFKSRGLIYRGDAGIDDLCEKFSSFTTAKQRREFNARFGEERERLMPQAMHVWFWDAVLDQETLAEKIKSLVAREQPIPPLPDDLDASAIASAYDQACATLLSSNKFSPNSLEQTFLKDLKKLSKGGLKASALQKTSQTQQIRIKAEIEKARAREQVAAIQAWSQNNLLLIDTRTNFDSPRRTMLNELFGQYPGPTDWKGGRPMKIKEINQHLINADSARKQFQQLIENYKYFVGKTKIDFLEIGRNSLLEAKEKIIDEAFDQQIKTAQDSVRFLTSHYKKTDQSTKVINTWLQCTLGTMMIYAAHITSVGGTLVLNAYFNAMSFNHTGQLAVKQQDELANRLAIALPDAIRSDFMPRAAGLRECYESICNLKNIPEHDLYTEPSTEEMFNLVFYKCIPSLRAYFLLEDIALMERWPFQCAKQTREDIENALQAAELPWISPGEEGKADRFLLNLQGLLAYSRTQLNALERLGEPENRNADGVTREKLEAARQNTAFAARALQEMLSAYAYLRDVAGEPPEADQIMGALARKILILETAALAARHIEPKLKPSDVNAQTGGTLPVPAQGGQAETPSEPHIPQEVDISTLENPETAQAENTIQGGPVPSMNAAAAAPPSENPSAVPSPLVQTITPLDLPVQQDNSLLTRLTDARSHCEGGKRMFSCIDGSPSQENNLLLATNARSEFKKGRDALRTLYNETASSENALPPEFPEPSALRTEMENAGFWTELTGNLLSTQMNRLLYPTADSAVEKLYQTAGACSIRRPQVFVHDFLSGDKMIEIEVHLHATAKEGNQQRNEPVQTMLLHCHVKQSLSISKPEELANIEPKQITAVHLKPLFYRILTNRTAPVRLTESGAMQSVGIPYCRVPVGIAQQWLKMAATQSA